MKLDCFQCAAVAELVDAMDSKPINFGCEGSSPSRGTLDVIACIYHTCGRILN